MTRARGVADYGYYPPVNNNILINPSFTVNQRAGTTASGGWGVDHAVDGYGPDRWYLRGEGNSGSTNVESSTVVDDATGINKLVVKHEGTASSEAYVEQFIEAVNIQGLYGKEMTLSFGYSDTGGSGIPKVLIRSWDALATLKSLYEAAPTSLGDNRWTCTVTLSTDGDIPDPNEIGMDVVILPNEANNAPSEWYLWETKLEAGSVPTPFVARQYGEELALCQRYYQFVRVVASDNPGTKYASWLLPNVMRAAGTILNKDSDNASFTMPNYITSEVHLFQSTDYNSTGTITFNLDAEL